MSKLIILLCFLGISLNIWGVDIWDKINHSVYADYFNYRIKYVEEFNNRIDHDVRKIFHPFEIVSSGFRMGMDNFSDYLNKKINNEFIIVLQDKSEIGFEDAQIKINELNEIIISDSVSIYLGKKKIKYSISMIFPDNVKWQIEE